MHLGGAKTIQIEALGVVETGPSNRIVYAVEAESLPPKKWIASFPTQKKDSVLFLSFCDR
jgi:hypothetical protein